MNTTRIITILVLAGCGGHEPMVSATPMEDGGLETDAALPDPHVTAGDAATTGMTCSEESKLVYVIDSQGHLRSFDPASLTFKDIGKFTCGYPYGPRAMAVGRDGTAYVSVEAGFMNSLDGTLFKVSLK